MRDTLQTVHDQMSADPDHWQVYLMDWVNHFRRNPHPDAVGTGLIAIDDRWAALLAATAEHLCDEAGISAPAWIYSVPSPKDPWFVSGVEGLKALALAQSPAAFRARKIFVLDNFLSRV